MTPPTQTDAANRLRTKCLRVPARSGDGLVPEVRPGRTWLRGRAVRAPFPFFNQRHRQDASVQTGHVVLLACFVLFVLCVVGVTGYFRLGAETAALSSSLRKAVP